MQDLMIMILTAAISGQLAVLKDLLQNNTVAQSTINQALRSAAEHGHIYVVKHLVNKCNADVREYDYFAICSAIKNGHKAIAKFLMQFLEHKEMKTVFKNIILNGCELKTFQFWFRKVEKAPYAGSLVDFALEKDNLDILKFLLNYIDNYSDMMSIAVENNSISCLRFLLDNAEKYEQDWRAFDNAYFLAYNQKKIDIFKIFFEHGYYKLRYLAYAKRDIENSEDYEKTEENERVLEFSKQLVQLFTNYQYQFDYDVDCDYEDPYYD